MVQQLGASRFFRPSRQSSSKANHRAHIKPWKKKTQRQLLWRLQRSSWVDSSVGKHSTADRAVASSNPGHPVFSRHHSNRLTALQSNFMVEKKSSCSVTVTPPCPGRLMVRLHPSPSIHPFRTPPYTSSASRGEENGLREETRKKHIKRV